MIAVEIPAALAEHPEVVPVDAPEPCPACGCYPTDIDQDVRARCEFCDDNGEGFALPPLVVQRVALAWRETCPTCTDAGVWWCARCGTDHSAATFACHDCGGVPRMVVGWTAEVEAVAPIVRDPEMVHGDLAIVNHWNELHALVGGRQIVRQVSGGVDWSPGRYALVLRDVRRYPVSHHITFTCRPFSGFAELDQVLA